MNRKKVLLVLAALAAAFVMAFYSVYFSYPLTDSDPIKEYDIEDVAGVDVGDGELRLKQKKYTYCGYDVLIVNAENLTGKDIDLILIATFRNAAGIEFKSVMKCLDGFPAGRDNYFVYEPNCRFESASLTVRAFESEKIAYAQYLETGHDVLIEAHPNMIPMPTSGEIKLYDTPRVELIMIFPFDCTYPDSTLMRYSADFVIFDTDGEIYYIGHAYGKDIANTPLYSDRVKRVIYLPEDVLWDGYVLPENLRGDLKCIIALSDAGID